MTKLLKKLLAGFMGLTASVGVAVGLNGGKSEGVKAADGEKTVTWTASSGGLGSSVGTGTIKTGDFVWNYTRTLVSGESYTGWASNCIQLGKKGGVESIAFSTSNIPGTITYVGAECSSYDNAHKVSISVGGTSYLASTATAKWITVSEKSGSGTSSGEINISFTDGTRALYIKSITVKYIDSTTPSEETKTEPEPVNKTVTELLSLSPSTTTGYLLTGTVSKWYGSNTNGTKFGNFYLSDGTNEILVYGATAKETSLYWSEVNGLYTFTNPQDFLTNETTTNVFVGSSVSMKGFLIEHNGVNQFNGIVTSVTNPSVASITATCNKESVNVGDELASSDFTVEATLTNGAKRDLNASEYSVTCSTSSVGEATATIKYNADESIQTTCRVNVVEPLLYYLVTDVSQIADGASVVFVGEESGAYYGMKTYVSGNNVRGTGELVVDNSTVKIVDDLGIYTVSISGGTYSFIDEDNRYLYSASSSENHMKAKDQLDDTGKWSISISDGKAEITNKGNSSRRLRFNYNGGSTMFSCYATNKTSGVNVSIYASSLKTVDEDIQGWIDAFLYLDEYTQNLGYCADAEHGYYAEAKEAMFTFLSGEQISDFQSNDLYADAYARYVAWAQANGDASPFTQASSSSRAFLANVNNDSMSLVIIVSVGLMVTAISYALLNKKKKLTK